MTTIEQKKRRISTLSQPAAESMKERMNRAKEAREGRRERMLTPFKHFFEIVSMYFNMDQLTVQDYVLDASENIDVLESICQEDGIHMITFFYQDAEPPDPLVAGRVIPGKPGALVKRIIVSSGSGGETSIEGQCVYFIKLNTIALTSRNVSEETFFGCMEISKTDPSSLLKAISITLDNIFKGILNSNDKIGRIAHDPEIPEGPEKKLLEHFAAFTSFMNSSERHVAEQTKFKHDPKINFLIEKEYAAEEIFQIAKNQQKLEAVESMVNLWYSQIEATLAESQQIRREADDVGPLVEIEQWRDKASKFVSILEQTKNRKVRQALKVLTIANSKIMRPWKEIILKISEAANEATDNLKYLTALEKYCMSIYSNSPVVLMESIPHLINAIRSVNSVARYYHTSERMTSLFIKITNQLVSGCRRFITDNGKTRLWDLSHAELKKKFNMCLKVFEVYRLHFSRVREEMANNPGERQFDFSDMYIFAKFDAFCKRLQKLLEVVDEIDAFGALAVSSIEGTEALLKKITNDFQYFKSKSYDYIDPRKTEFEFDYEDFRKNIFLFEAELNTFMDDSIAQHTMCIEALKLLKRFENLNLPCLNVKRKLETILKLYETELEYVITVYTTNKDDPLIPRGMPPIAGRIAWARQLFYRCAAPLKYLQANYPEGFALSVGIKVTKTFNRIAKALVHFEMNFHELWLQHVDTVRDGLAAPLLVVHPQTKEIFVNFDPFIRQTIHEACTLAKMELEVPEIAKLVVFRKKKLFDTYTELEVMVSEIQKLKDSIPSSFTGLLDLSVKRLDAALLPGIKNMTWLSMSISSFFDSCRVQMGNLQRILQNVHNIKSARIDETLVKIASTIIPRLPDEPITLEQFLETTQKRCDLIVYEIQNRTHKVEEAVNELITMFLNESNIPIVMVNGVPIWTTPATTYKDDSAEPREKPTEHEQYLEHITEECREVFSEFKAKHLEALISCIKLSLDAIRKRIATANLLGTRQAQGKKKLTGKKGKEVEETLPLLIANIVLVIPNLACQPSIDDMQQGLNKACQAILEVTKKVAQWGFPPSDSKQQVSVADTEVDVKTQNRFKNNFYKSVVENKEITKVIMNLSTLISDLKDDIQDSIQNFSSYRFLWEDNREAKIQDFVARDPILVEYKEQIVFYEDSVNDIQAFPVSYRVGSVDVRTDLIKLALSVEAKTWKIQIGKQLNNKYRQKMDEMADFINDNTKKLQRPVKNLDDVRFAMQCLEDVREKHLYIDMMMTPVEEAYSLLQKFNLPIMKEELEHVYMLRFSYTNLLEIADKMQNHLNDIQPKFRDQLLKSVGIFKADVEDFENRYEEHGPMEPGIPAREASDRVTIFQAQFDDLINKFESYSGGETLFGLPINDYPVIQKVQKEMGLLQKLYSLYNQVMESIEGYSDLLWSDVDIHKINDELIDFQNKCKKMPRGLKDWPAYADLKKKIDDFSESCPLLEFIANKAMKDRHWNRLEDLMGYKFDIKSESFQLRNIIDAPLLKYRDDIEDICTSAIKERDIEAKLKQVIADWTVRNIVFTSFKNRGEIMLKPADASEIIGLLDDSLLVMGTLLSNRYNAPFKREIQLWVQKLSNTADMLVEWLAVQSLWIYLEAVFIGGDIAKQLPKEAKRFQGIDKAWVKMMSRAHENPNVIQCCVGDETMIQLLPHLMEQLEACQKSLAGYLESKRLIFPRFFFVSDPTLLEILGQASDSHSIQPHLSGVFENVNTLEFHEKDYDKILSYSSREKEKIPMVKEVWAKGNVELWLGELLREHQRSLGVIIKSAYQTVTTRSSELLPFLYQFPAQPGLLGIQFLWTKDSEDAIRLSKSDRKIMNATNQRFLDLLNTLIEQTTLDLDKFTRIKFETLITIHVHQRDIFDELTRLKIKSANEFDWLKQSRFYYLEEEFVCLVKITDVNFIYQNEYMGCSDRLVITPLTDRCYITLAQAIVMSMGGAPAGPAGTGKTETVKDMGKALGKYVVVFNCSDQMDFRGLGRIFKGLAQSGSWGCFDEFNRIDLPVLSVAAQQIHIVLMAKKEKKAQFVFSDGDVVDLNPEFGLFITMNPGYAGRQELPENLKVLFRTVAMMVPDRQIIMRVKLASCGYIDNVVLAQKFYVLYKLCEEQLTKQVHYDFGLRNILSVLRTLGSEKRLHPTDSELMVVMRVLRDMNLSKLVDEDEPLFLSLISDLFPGIHLESADYPQLQVAIASQVKLAGLINHPPWNLKLIQLFEQQRVRHGMMALGPSGAGKTCCIHVLMGAMTETGAPHREMRMNPKAITAPQMFGRLDVATNDWTDGIFSNLWRRSLKVKPGEHVWLVLDGPVDAVWIENLNSVLDDNKTLTLANGDRIPMSPTCKIVFEPDNIDNASPATVSRNGMVFMSSSFLDWKPILKAWLKTRSDGETTLIEDIYNKSFNDLYTFLNNTLSPKMKILECNYIRQSIDLMEGLIPDKEQTLPKAQMERLYVFSIMWSIGALLEWDDKYKLEQFMRKHPSKMNLPQVKPEETIFEYVVDKSGKWEHWNNRIIEYEYPSTSVPDYTSILIPNVDNVRSTFLIDIIAKQGKGVLLIGEPGTAKTVMIKGYTLKYDAEYYISKSMNFSSATVPLMFQRIMESYIEKRMGTTYGPPGGRKMTVFIDDINMPVINEWGDQICNEIVRQVMSSGGFYNLERPGEFTRIIDTQFMAAMIHPGGGRNDIPPRLKRQFNIFNCTLPSNASIDKIFGIIGCGYFCPERFKDEIVEFVPRLITATRILWQQTKQKLLPTPAKFHYIFNLRDLSRIWQGILKIEDNELPDVQTLLALWNHECTRTIADRFVNETDKKWFRDCMYKTVTTTIGDTYAAMMLEEPYFVDFFKDIVENTDPEATDEDVVIPQIYEIVPSFDFLRDRLNHFMTLYNETERGQPMDLVFFRDSMIHLMKISRIIKTSLGHALLVGVGGSGKQSLNKLATFIAGYKLFNIVLTKTYNVSNLIDDLKFLYRIAGLKGLGITFIFTDNEIKEEGFLEYLNNVLGGGDVTVLFPKDEMDEILSELTGPMKKEFPRRIPTPDALSDFFTSRCKSNLHVVLCFSPVGDKFRSRSFKFPGLISGCTIDWFSKWPTDALTDVAEYFLGSFEIVCPAEMKSSLIYCAASTHESVEEACTSYFQRFRRANFVTPKSYLSFLTVYKNIYSVKVEYIGELAFRMTTGLAKLLEATESVAVLAQELVEKEKELAVASMKADKVLEEVTRSAEAATLVKNAVQKVKDKAQKIVDGIAVEKAIAEEKLEAAKPAMKAAEDALLTIKAQDIALVRKLGKPPHLVMRIMDVVLILFQKKLDPVVPDPDRICPKPSWGESLKLMSGAGFLFQLQNFPKDTINEETIELMAPYIEMPDYNYESAIKTAGAVTGLLSWTIAMVQFFSVNKEVLPLKANLIVQESRLTAALGELNEAQTQLDEKQKELDAVQALYDAAMVEKEKLVADAENCRFKMSTASALINGLAGERTRWTEQSKLFKSMIDRCVGDVLILAGFISYAGPFNSEYRNSFLLKTWQSDLANRHVLFSSDINIVDSLVDPATIGEWTIQGLPTDDLSTQNGIIVNRSLRFPLLIDPQGQGKIWIINKEKENNLMVTSLNNKLFRTHIEEALANGYPLLIEDVGEFLDPALDNVLDKNYLKSGKGLKVKLGDKECEVSTDFRLIITTKLPNPTYTPEISAKTSIIDFTVTMKGLEDQLLGRVILAEKMELEVEKKKLFEMVTSFKRRMQELEDNLLYKLTSTKGSLVEDESLLVVLSTTKDTAAEVKDKLAIAAETEHKINTAREEFRPVAARGSTLYFLISEMTLVNYMYQTSLKQFLQLFDRSMDRSQKSPVTSKRIGIIIDYMTYEVHKYTSRGLYAQDKFLFVLQLALKIDLARGFVKHDEFQNFLKGGAALDLNAVTPKPARWITDITWLNLVELSKIPQFREIQGQVQRSEKVWKVWFDKDAPEEEVIPDGYNTSLDNFRKLLLIRSWCPDRTLSQARKYIADSLGQRFAVPVILNLEESFQESDVQTPLIGLLSLGGDPTQEIQDLARKFNLFCELVSMGQGQAVHARRLLNQCMTSGGWTLLQNCHLGLDFMDELLDLMTTAEEGSIHPDFRLWITTEPHPSFPIGLLQISIKFTNQPPEGIRAGLLRTYSTTSQEHLDYTEAYQWKPVLYAVGFLHSCLQERRKYGPLGWNIPYEFNSADYTASVQFVMNHLDDMDPKKGVSWVTVRYMLSEVQYGGRVTDDFDKRLINTFAKVWFGEFMFTDSFTFHGEYKIPKAQSVNDYLNFIQALPAVDSPQVLGLHSNADITYQSAYAQSILETIMNIQPKESSAGAGESREDVVYRMADDMMDKMPPNYAAHEVKARLEKMGALNPLNIILKQEVDRMQRCIATVRVTLSDLKLAIEGTIIMNESLKDALDKIYDARVPDIWKKVSWDSATIGFWFTELLERNEQFYRWVFSGRPPCFWLTGFFNPQGFLTAMRQEVTRLHKGWALDMVSVFTDVTKSFKEEISSGPPEGVYIYGLFLDGAGWDRKMARLIEQAPKVLSVPLPVMHIYALNTMAPKDPKLYLCPMYKKPRRTDLNFVTPTWLKTQVSPDHWILRAVALLCDIK